MPPCRQQAGERRKNAELESERQQAQPAVASRGGTLSAASRLCQLRNTWMGGCPPSKGHIPLAGLDLFFSSSCFSNAKAIQEAQCTGNVGSSACIASRPPRTFPPATTSASGIYARRTPGTGDVAIRTSGDFFTLPPNGRSGWDNGTMSNMRTITYL